MPAANECNHPVTSVGSLTVERVLLLWEDEFARAGRIVGASFCSIGFYGTSWLFPSCPVFVSGQVILISNRYRVIRGPMHDDEAELLSHTRYGETQAIMELSCLKLF